MPDFIDRVQELEARRAEQINQAARIAAPTARPTHCHCGALIPERRRTAVPGCRCCIDCAELAARQQQHFSRPR